MFQKNVVPSSPGFKQFKKNSSWTCKMTASCPSRLEFQEHDGVMNLNNELEGMWKEGVINLLEILSQHLLEG
jgi:hypothetical protein